jgi:hypothetical protein
MKDIIFDFLAKLETNHPGHRVDIMPMLSEIYQRPQDNLKFSPTLNDIARFLENLKVSGYIDYDDHQTFKLINIDGRIPDAWLTSIKFSAAIISGGFDYLKKARNAQQENALNKSAIDTNKSIIDTNKSVQSTNKALIDNARDQIEINTKMVNTALAQTNILDGQVVILKRQTTIFFFTAIFGLGTLLLTGITLYRDIRKDKEQTQLQQQSKEISILQRQLAQTMNQLSHLKEAKQTSPKKN